MCQTVESISIFVCVCVYVCDSGSPLRLAVIRLETCVFVLPDAPSGHVDIRLGLHVCFSQPSQAQCRTWVIFIEASSALLLRETNNTCLDNKKDEQT